MAVSEQAGKRAGNDFGLMAHSQSRQVRASVPAATLDSGSDQHDKEGLIELRTSTGS